MSKDKMKYIWHDYDPNTMQYVEKWLDESAVQFTGLEEGFQPFYEYWVNEDGFVLGQNFWCKVVFEHEEPFAVAAFCLYENTIKIMEVLVKPEKRGQGKGSELLKELLNHKEIIGFQIHKSEAVIYPNNTASQKAFEKAGFKYHHSHKDADGNSMIYVYNHNEVQYETSRESDSAYR